MEKTAYPPSIWIDADSCPAAVRNETVRISSMKNPKIQVIFVANREIDAKTEGHSMVVCRKEKDSADDYILSHAQKDDIVITKDILFAEKLVKKGICAINDRGTAFSSENIVELIEDREFNLQLAKIGFTGTKKHSYSQKELKEFTRCLEYQLKKLCPSG